MLTFGTDGLRGVANRDLTPELVTALGRAAARVLVTDGAPFLIGRDTRLSGPMLQSALTAGLAAEGIDVVDVGIIPTPGMARLAEAQSSPAAVISASHNPYYDNGIKFFAAGGTKLPDELEQHLELELRALVNAQVPPSVVEGVHVGHAGRLAKGDLWYAEQLVGLLEGRLLDGLQVVLDCANGAASKIALQVFEDADADVEIIHNLPNGTNINDDCGSTHPESLQKAVLDAGADVGFAFDGDADRVIAVDANGDLIDGDQLIAMHAVDMRFQGQLEDNTVVITVMSNLGFRHAMAAQGIEVVETSVGDRNVLESLEEGGYSLGGEQSGHIIFRRHASTGDGILTALLTADLMVRHQKPIHELGGVMQRLPQVLQNVRVVDLERLDDCEEVWAAVQAAQDELGDSGRVLLRKSGTEPVVRVMVEAESEDEANRITDDLRMLLLTELGAPE